MPQKPKRRNKKNESSTQTNDEFYRDYYERKLAVEAEKRKRQHEIVTRSFLETESRGGASTMVKMDETKISIEANHEGRGGVSPGGGGDDDGGGGGGGGKHGYASGILNHLFGGVSCHLGNLHCCWICANLLF